MEVMAGMLKFDEHALPSDVRPARELLQRRVWSAPTDATGCFRALKTLSWRGLELRGTLCGERRTPLKLPFVHSAASCEMGSNPNGAAQRV